ncbi:hypothetical protein [Bosea vaviloviae]|uniref:Uncharacterized protein n=1 Tax=Bosea vaviloviae TaxID=1526658 RepID=A0A1D7UC53_9HYPH|nr:hypothetical protein [Bosea vaviloviae]AOO84956.1 hypothetical protein BHK69_29970 [Bosea vaviloviae]
MLAPSRCGREVPQHGDKKCSLLAGRLEQRGYAGIDPRAISVGSSQSSEVKKCYMRRDAIDRRSLACQQLHAAFDQPFTGNCNGKPATRYATSSGAGLLEDQKNGLGRPELWVGRRAEIGCYSFDARETEIFQPDHVTESRGFTHSPQFLMQIVVCQPLEPVKSGDWIFEVPVS